MQSLGTVYFADGHTEPIEWFECIGDNEVRFRTHSGTYIYNSWLKKKGRFAIPYEAFYRRIFTENYYGDSEVDYIQVDICRIEIFKN